MAEQTDWKPLLLWLSRILEGLAMFLDKLSVAQKETNIAHNSNVVEIWNKAFAALVRDISKDEFMSIAEISYTLGKLNSINIQNMTPDQLVEFAGEAKRSSEKLKKILERK